MTSSNRGCGFEEKLGNTDAKLFNRTLEQRRAPQNPLTLGITDAPKQIAIMSNRSEKPMPQIAPLEILDANTPKPLGITDAPNRSERNQVIN